MSNRNTYQYHLRQFVLFVTFFTLIGCASHQAMDKSQASLYERLGGKPAIEAVVDQFMANIANDDRINGFFIMTDGVRFKTMLVDQICQASGGPCTYQGKDMVTVHKGRGITEADFNATVEGLVSALNTLKVPAQEQQELLALLGPMRDDIVSN